MLPLPAIRPKTAAGMRFRLNIWMPLLFSGIRITHISDDFTHIRATLKNWRSTQNSHGTQFGGSLFAFTDPIYALLLGCIFGETHYVWDKSAEIDFVSPGRGAVYLDCSISPEQIEEIRQKTANGEKYLPEFTVRVFDEKGDTVAMVKRTVYLRLKKEFRPKQTHTPNVANPDPQAQ